MIWPKFITFTGIDDRTDLMRADALARQYPIEWGVLYGPADGDPVTRFPSIPTIDAILGIAGDKALHLCDRVAREFAENKVLPPDLGKPERVRRFGRFQVNQVRTITFSHFGPSKIVLQCQTLDADANTAQLFDLSAGRGILPETVPALIPGQLVGYAGGIGPDTVLDYLSRINGDGEFWIDMETHVRTDEWFDLDKVEKVCKAVFG
ncbi:MAG: phosphoribosylanthranilate isomerase [Rhodospirillales bacterium]|nr:phosphoribosylanthranilate isomerase [Rhodospirillales bacterium]